MKYLISGGGTGGHINPGLAIAREILKNEPEAQILFVGTKNGLESRLIPREGFDISYIDIKGFKRKLSGDTFKTLWKLVSSFHGIGKILKDYRPDAVIGTGGYVCGPVVFYAALKKIPTLVHEQNAFPGVTNKILSRYVDLVAISFEEARKLFKGKARVALTGNPVRGELFSYNREAARAKLNLQNNKPLVVLFGGSLGAEHMNKCVTQMINKRGKELNYNLIVATGLKNYDSAMAEVNQPLPENVRIEPYFFNMDEVLGAADLAVCRGGAITLSELGALGIPSVLIPSPYVAENHQEHNARAFEHRGAAVVILQSQLNSEILYGQIQKLIDNKDLRLKMASNAKKLGMRSAGETLYSALKQVMREKKP